MQTLAWLMALAALSGPGGGEPQSEAADVTLRYCVISAIYKVDVPAQQEGMLTALHVKEGESVAEGALLAEIDDRMAKVALAEAEAELKKAEKEAGSNVRVRAAIAAEELAEAEFVMTERLFQTSATSKAELERKRLAQIHAEHQIELAQHEVALAGLTADALRQRVAAAQIELDRCRPVAPWDGMVAAAPYQQGEWMTRGTLLMQLVRLDTLRVEGFVKTADFSPAEVAGAKVSVEVEYAGGRTLLREGTITHVGTSVEGGEFRVWAEIENVREENEFDRREWVLRPGMFASMTVHPVSAYRPTDRSLTAAQNP